MIAEIKTHRSITKAEIEPFVLLDMDMSCYTFARRTEVLVRTEFPQLSPFDKHFMDMLHTHYHTVYPALEPERDIIWTHRLFMEAMRKRRKTSDFSDPASKIITNTYINITTGKKYYGKSYVYVSTWKCDTIEQVGELLYDVFAEMRGQWDAKNKENRRESFRVAIPYGFLCRSDSDGIRRFRWREVYRLLHFLSDEFQIEVVIYNHQKYSQELDIRHRKI